MHKINTDRVTGNLSCSESVTPSSAGLRVASDIRAVAHNSVKVVSTFNHGEISHYFMAIHVLISNRNDVHGFAVKIQQDFLFEEASITSDVSCECGGLFFFN